MDYMERYAFWRNAGLPESVNRELDSLQGNEEELKSRFGSELQFGTAGMRGIMGAGSNRLNFYTVRRAAQGMAAWLSGTDPAEDRRHRLRLPAQFPAVCRGLRRGICGKGHPCLAL